MRTSWALGATLLALSPEAHAAAASQDNVFDLGEVLVTARARDGSTLGSSTIGEEQLRTFEKVSVDEAMDLIPGASSSNTGGSRNERLVFIRGFDRFQTTLSIDGVRVFLPADNRIDFGRFLTADLSAIQVAKGYVSVLDGPGGIGGAINLVTRKPEQALELEAVGGLTFDRDLGRNSYSFSGRIGTKQERYYLQASGARTERDDWTLSDDFKPIVAALEDGGKRGFSESEDYRINLKAGYTPNATDEYAISYTKQAGSKNAPLHVSDTAGTRYWDWPYWDIDSLYFLSNTSLGGESYLKTRFYLNSFDNALFAYDSAAQTTQSLPRAFRSYYDDEAYGANIQLGLAVTDANMLRAAFHYRHDRHDERQDGFSRVGSGSLPYSEPWQRTQEETYSLALEDTQSIGETVDLIVGLSYDWTDLSQAEDVSVFAAGGALTLAPVLYPLNDMDAFNWQATLSYRPDSNTRLYASVSSRERFPTLFERFSSRFGTAVPNPDIGPERATNYEIGGSLEFGRVSLDAAVFYSDVEDALLSVPVVFGPPINGTLNQTRNVGDGEYYGFEFGTTARLSDSVTLGGNYTYLRRDIDDPTNAAFRPQGVPKHKLFAYVDWRATDALTLTASLEAASGRWTVTASSAIVPPRFYRTDNYALFNLAADWQITGEVDLLVGARNLFDENYFLTDGFPEEGRSFYLNLRARL